MEVEEYDCGCRIHFHPLSPSEVGNEFPRRPAVIPSYTPCSRHKDPREIPPSDSRLIVVRTNKRFPSDQTETR